MQILYSTSSHLRLALGLLLLAGAVAVLAADLPSDALPPSSPETIRWASSVGEVVFQHRLHTEAGHRETGLQPHVDTVAVQRELQKLKPRRAVRQRQEA